MKVTKLVILGLVLLSANTFAGKCKDEYNRLHGLRTTGLSYAFQGRDMNTRFDAFISQNSEMNSEQQEQACTMADEIISTMNNSYNNFYECTSTYQAAVDNCSRFSRTWLRRVTEEYSKCTQYQPVAEAILEKFNDYKVVNCQ
jgi:hypothetical protein